MVFLLDQSNAMLSLHFCKNDGRALLPMSAYNTLTIWINLDTSKMGIS